MSRAYRLGIALLSAYLTFAVLVIAYGQAPLAVAALLWEGTWGSSYGAGQVLFKATPILFAGVAAEFALRGGLFNVGVEGQLAIGSLVTGVVGAQCGASWGPLGLLVAMLSGVIAAGLWAGIPAILRVYFGAHEVIATIMLNRLADCLIAFLFSTGIAEKGTAHTHPIGIQLPRLEVFIPWLRGSSVSVSILFAFALVGLSPLFFRRTLWGRQLTLIGQGPAACAANGIPVARYLALAFMVSGAIAGLGASATVLGYKGYYEQGLGAGAGFSGLAVAMLGRGDPWLMVFSALLFGTLDQGGLSINAYVPKELMLVVTGAVIMTVGWVERSRKVHA